MIIAKGGGIRKRTGVTSFLLSILNFVAAKNAGEPCFAYSLQGKAFQ